MSDTRTCHCEHIYSQHHDKIEAPPSNRCETPRALLSGHASSRTTPRGLHTTCGTYTASQRPHGRTTRRKEHLLLSKGRRRARHKRAATGADRNRMGACCSQSTTARASWAVVPAATEGGATEAASKATAEPPTELRASRVEACPQTGACEGRLARRILRASLTSRAARLTQAIVAVAGALGSSRLRLHLDQIARRSAPVQGRQERCT